MTPGPQHAMATDGTESRMATSTPESETVVAEVRPGDYGTRVIAIEPGGAEFVPLKERHGRPANNLFSSSARPTSMA